MGGGRYPLVWGFSKLHHHSEFHFLSFARSRGGGGGSINPFAFTLLPINLDSIASFAAADAIELLPRCLHL